MPTTTVGIYEAVIEQSYGGIVCFNVMHYLNPTLGDDNQALLAAQVDLIIVAEMANIQNQTVTYTNIRVANLTGVLADANRNPTTSAGNVVGDPMASFVSAAFRYDRTTKETRNGAKRYVGMVEQNVAASKFTAGFNVLLDAFAVILETSLLSFDPIILRKPDSPPGTYTYNDIVGVSNLDRVTTQNSRKNF